MNTEDLERRLMMVRVKPAGAREARELAEDSIAALKRCEADQGRLIRWVSDLQSGMFINCVYCGHRYGPDDEVPATMADVLKEHVEQCPEHPMSKLREKLSRRDEEWTEDINAAIGDWGGPQREHFFEAIRRIFNERKKRAALNEQE